MKIRGGCSWDCSDGKELFYINAPHDGELRAVTIKWSTIPEPGAPQKLIPLMEEYALINVPNAWKKGQRNPVTYTTLEKLKN